MQMDIYKKSLKKKELQEQRNDLKKEKQSQTLQY